MELKERNARRYLTLLGLVFVLCFSLKAQSTLHCLEDGAWLPVFEVRGESPYCFTGDGLLKSSNDKVTMLASNSFSDSYIKVEVLENIRSGVVKSDGALQFTSEHGWLQFTARVTAREDISDAYFVMRYVEMGEAEFSCESIGDMKAGKPKIIKILRKLGYEMPEQLHFYSGMQEIRTNLVPSSYTYRFGDFILEKPQEPTKGEMVAVAN